MSNNRRKVAGGPAAVAAPSAYTGGGRNTVNLPMMEEQAPQPAVATDIAWSGGQQPQGANSLTAEGTPTEADIANTSGQEVATQVEQATGDTEFAGEAAKVVEGATGVESYLANLDKQIDEQTNKRKKARLLAFGMALLGGASMGQALQSAQVTPFFDDEQLDMLLEQRKDLMAGLHAEYLGSQGVWTPAVQSMQDGKIRTAAAAAKDAQANLEAVGDVSWNIADNTEAQNKNLSLGNEAITGAAELKALEDNAPAGFNPSGIQEQFTAALVRDKEGNITGLNQAVLNAMNPYMAAYLRATMKVITAKLRKESGAAISASEWASEMAKIVPSSNKEFKSKQEYRDRIITGLVSASGAPNRDLFYEAAGFNKDYNGDEWYNDLFGTPNANAVSDDGEAVDLDSLLGG